MIYCESTSYLPEQISPAVKTPVLGKQGKSVIWLFLKNTPMENHMKSYRQDLFIDMAVDRFIFKNNQITLSPCFSFTFKAGVELPKKGASS